MKRMIAVLGFVAAGAFAQTNPFFNPSSLPFQAPPFDQIKDPDYQPAIEEGMKRQIAEIDAIANTPDPPTFENTIVAMEKSGDLLTRVAKVFFNLAQSNTDDAMQKVESEESPRLAAHQDTIFLNPKLFARIKAIYDQRSSLNLDPEAQYLAYRYYRNFIRAGAQLSDADKTTLRALNQEESTLSTQYRQRILADTDASAITVESKADLTGLSDSDLAAAAQRAKDRGLTGKYVLTLQNTTQQPPLTFLKNRALREKLFTASSQRGSHGGPNDTKAIVERMAQLRAQKAKLLGFSTYAAYVLDDQMAKTPDIAIKLMTDMVLATPAKAREQAVTMQKLIDKQKGGFQLAPWDWQYYAEQLRKAQYALDEAQVKQYFELDRVRK